MIEKPQISSDQWLMRNAEFNPFGISQWETLFTLANGYAGVRASLPCSPDLGNPGFFIAGVYDRVKPEVNEIVNLPIWIGLDVNVNGFDMELTAGVVDEFNRVLDMRHGVLWTHFVYTDDGGQKTRWRSARLMDMRRGHIGVISGSITPLNYSGTGKLTGSLDAYSVKYGSDSGQCHFGLVNTENRGADAGIALDVETAHSDIRISERARLEVPGGTGRDVRLSDDLVEESLRFDLNRGEPVPFCKKVTFSTSRDADDPGGHAESELASIMEESAEKIALAHAQEWKKLWEEVGVDIEGDDRAQRAARFNVFHLVSVGKDDDTVSIGAKGLHGPGYRGAIFWDTEQYMLPFFTYTRPRIARSLLKHRYNHLEEARENARRVNCPGARYPWTSDIDGHEASFNHFGWQDHQTADVAFAVDRYLRATEDREFYLEYGAELIIETARFWTGRLTRDEETGLYVCDNIMGSDEIHEGVNNNALTNYLARFNLRRAARAVSDLKKEGLWADLREGLDLPADCAERWRKMAEKIYMPWDEERGVHEQFDGYFELEDRLADRSMRPVEYTGKVLNELEETQINKQADTVLLYYLFPDDFLEEVRCRGYEYYEPRTAHCSSLSRPIYAAVAAALGKSEEAYRLWLRAAEIDYGEEASCDTGIHAASLGGVWQALVFGFAGLQEKDGELSLEPHLPECWDALRFNFRWRGKKLRAEIGRDGWRVDNRSEAD
ncbi:MAG: glycoside hydrolase family 65 protein [Candidatus Brocadiia bacterium]